jgi:hypothetical protein
VSGECDLSRNDIIFNKLSISSYMQVIFIGTHWSVHGRFFSQRRTKEHYRLPADL